MARRVGIIALLHESNTFLTGPTRLADFQRDWLFTGSEMLEKLKASHHEAGGFLEGLEAAGITPVPVLAARALPHGPITAETAQTLVTMLEEELHGAGDLDGLLVAPHGAAVAQQQLDFDGYWLSRLRERFPRPFPIIGTLDLHANLSPRMVESCDALIAYRTNPHLDQKERGIEAAGLMVRTLAGEIRPTCAAAFPPMATNIERQATAEPHWQALLQQAEDLRGRPGVLSVSLVHGFPYADVPEMGSATIVVTDGNALQAETLAGELARAWWDAREQFTGVLISVEEAVAQAGLLPGPVCLLDMGDNIGGGSPGDSTILVHALREARYGAALAVLYDPLAVQQAKNAGIGSVLEMRIGGRSGPEHGQPVQDTFKVLSLHDGQFEEPAIRHGGIRTFNQGESVVVRTLDGLLTLLVTSQRMAPFSLAQITSCGLVPRDYQVIVAKGVHAPVAAYAPVCPHRIRVNTPGATSADLTTFRYESRRRPLYPFEPNCPWDVTS